jgi:hypothetical protein
MLVDPEDAYAVQVGGVVVDQLAAGIDGDLVDQFPTDTEDGPDPRKVDTGDVIRKQISA